MKKKYLCFLLSILLLPALAGCGGETGVGVIGGADGPTEIIVSGPGVGDNKDGEPAAQPETAETGYAFVYKSLTVTPDAQAAPIVEALGEPISYFEAPSCAFEGLDKVYTFPGFMLYTYPDGSGADYISSVVLMDDSVTTPEGLMIGSSVSEIEAAYGTPSAQSGNLYDYERAGVRLRFILDDGLTAVISIQYISLAADAA